MIARRQPMSSVRCRGVGLSSVTLRVLICAPLAVLLVAGSARAFTPSEPWPPRSGSGALFAHYGEEHWDDDDGLVLLPKVVADVARYKPSLVTMSGDKADDGTIEQLTRWRDIMDPYDSARVPYFAATGNHDRKAPPGFIGGISPAADLSNYMKVFASRPYPFGDEPAYPDPKIGPRSRPATDPDGASSHYYVDYGNVRWVFIDNSCFGITLPSCDSLQNPPFPDPEGNQGQYDFLRRRASEARDQGKRLFVVMHMPTRDPRDQSTVSDAVNRNHTMAAPLEGADSPDNVTFEEVAEQAGVDAVFVAHIKGHFLYRGRGDIPYYIDGGAGGELHTNGPVGVDHGYWHGYRLISVGDDGRITTDTVPIFEPDGISITGPERVKRGTAASFEAFGRQPVHENKAKVPALELRDPAPRARTAQQQTPTSTPRSSLPAPARIWTSRNRFVLQPVARGDDDPRRDSATQTDSGGFRALCPGRTDIEISSGWESSRKFVTVPSFRGKILRSARRRASAMRRGERTRLVTVNLAQPAEVIVRIRRGKKRIATLAHRCVRGRKPTIKASWRGYFKQGGKTRKAKRGKYSFEVKVRSDRRSKVRTFPLELR